jgi:hypothetical protein
MKSGPRIFWSGSALLLYLIMAIPSASRVQSQGNSHYFPETDHTVRGNFWEYWQSHGGLAQQGYPISGELQERSATDGRLRSVQYFERALFEYHPENTGPNKVLLSHLGRSKYKGSYDGEAKGQRPNRTNGRYFSETGHWIGGMFRTYWEQHGGLAQHGYPISDELTEERVEGDYTVQYFERAVFEYHPENRPPYNILLTQLGTLQYGRTYEQFCAGCGGGPSGGPGLPPTPPTTEPTFTCDVSSTRNGWIEPTSFSSEEIVGIEATGFTTSEEVAVWLTAPNGAQGHRKIFNTDMAVLWNGTFSAVWGASDAWASGRWIANFEGLDSKSRATIAFCVYHNSKTRIWPLTQYGETSRRVKIAQYLLRARGYTGVAASSTFDARTRDAVRRFQGITNLPITGIVDPKTWEALVIVLRYGDTGDSVRAAQMGLWAWGQNLLEVPNGWEKIDTQAVDGMFEGYTQKALRQFQGLMDIEVNGIIDTATWYHLVRN